MPSVQILMWLVLQALRDLGGSAKISEINEKVAELGDFTEELQAVPHKPDSSRSGSEIEYRIAWARTSLKKVGCLDNSARGVWSLARPGYSVTRDEMESSYAKLAKRYQSKGGNPQTVQEDDSFEGGEPYGGGDGSDQWRTVLLDRLLDLPPDAFERLVQRLLREAGFLNVEVLGKSGDGGLDGVGVYRPSLVSFPIYFQCKRYKGTVSAGAVRDFRGAMSGRGEKGLLITTGSFTKGAREEATRDGAPPVDFVNGDELCDLLKDYQLGVKVAERVIEDIEVDAGFFDQF